jgi:DNA-binding HxlR family transcriptional regulator
MASPKPGRAVRGSQSGRAIMALLDLLGRRWTLRIVWELRAARLNFRALQAACGDASPTVTSRRLTELRDAGFVDLTDEGYGLTAHGHELLEALEPLSRCATRWQERGAARR